MISALRIGYTVKPKPLRLYRQFYLPVNHRPSMDHELYVRSVGRWPRFGITKFWRWKFWENGRFMDFFLLNKLTVKLLKKWKIEWLLFSITIEKSQKWFYQVFFAGLIVKIFKNHKCHHSTYLLFFAMMPWIAQTHHLKIIENRFCILYQQNALSIEPAF